ncbi:hypothetical protein K5D33_08310 [Pseudomonas cichorii]|nr:hypothetical protein [Pseudomonas cichorii]MBX8534725.1 hypothetical protein [Pseudomonas cichorii]
MKKLTPDAPAGRRVGNWRCTSFLQGKQYAVPGPNEPSATTRLKAGNGARLDAMTLSDNGCYAGYTILPSGGD